MRKELDKILQNSTKGHKKEIAYELGCHTNTIDREMNGGVKWNFIEKALAFMDCSEGNDIINYLAASQGGFFVPDTSRINLDDFKVIPRLLKEFSEFTAEMSSSLVDECISESELESMRKEWADCNAVVQGFFMSVERGDYNE
jgi:hypothetical protein